ncbi:MAG: hypothetical protein U0O22_08535 [Acutalibacteraceae bacterium]
MKILEIDYDYYYYPQNISCIDDFIKYANNNYNSFIKLTRFETENCAFPYFIREETKEVYVNVATMEKITETEITVLPRLDYDIRLEQVVKKKCIDCVHYEEDAEGDNLKGHREKISLDGECWGYEKKD